MSFRYPLYALALLALLAPPLASTASTLPVADFIRHPAFGNVVISPDGKYLAVVSAVKDSEKYQLAILPTHSVLGKKPQVTAHYNLRDYELFASVFWVNDERIAAATAVQYGGFDRPFWTGELYAVNADGSLQQVLAAGNQSRVGNDTENGGFYFGGLLHLGRDPNTSSILVYGSEGGTFAAYLVDTYTGKHHRVASPPVANGGLLADHDGDVRLAWGTNDKTGWPELYYRAAGSMDWQNETSLINNKRAASASLATGGPIMFGPDNKSVYFEFWADNPAETMALYSYDFTTGKKALVYANPMVDLGGEYDDYDSFIESFSGDNLVGLRIMPGKLETLALDPKSPRIQLLAELSQTLPNVQVDITSWTRDGTEAIVKTWSDTEPGTYYLYSSSPKPSLTFLFDETPWIKSDDLSPMQPISYRSRDGLTIHGYLTVPRGTSAKNLPLVVYVHGGPHGIRTDWGFDPTDFDSVTTQMLANHGYAVLAVNYRGSGGYGLKFMAAGFRHWGDTMQDDLADGVNWAVKQGIADPKRVCIFGASYGGYAALMSAERFPDLFQCAIGYDGVYDLATQETRASDTSRFASGRLYLTTVLGHDPAQLKAFSPAYNVDKLKIPVFLLHGGRDERAPVAGYDEMVAAIKRRGTPLKTLYEPNEEHGFYQTDHREKAWNDILAFLGQYIGPAGFTPQSGNSSTH
ncbi:MAG: alpha/beta hydrolase family protein [Gammaproteobacteria bacterium]